MNSNMTIEQFDSLCADGNVHMFSGDYQRRKAELLRSLDEASALNSQRKRSNIAAQSQLGGRGISAAGGWFGKWRLPRIAAAAAVVLCLAIPVGAYAAISHFDFFDGALGTGWRASQPAQESTQSVDGKPAVSIVFPASEVAPVDQDLAEALLAGAMSDEAVSFTSPDGHELTISHAVRSEYAMIYQFTLHRDGGVTALEWSDKTNNVAAKGAYMPDDQQFGWAAAGDDFLYVDPSASTDDLLVGYGYTVFNEALPAGEDPQVTLYTWDVPANSGFGEDQFHMQTLEIPCAEAVESLTFANADGGQVRVSPFGLVLDNETGLFTPLADGYNMARDSAFTRTITLHMADGSTYVVRDADNDIDNTLSMCGYWSGDESDAAMLNMAFNRLVDPATVVSIDVVVADASGEDDIDSYIAKMRDGESPLKTVTYQAV